MLGGMAVISGDGGAVAGSDSRAHTRPVVVPVACKCALQLALRHRY